MSTTPEHEVGIRFLSRLLDGPSKLSAHLAVEDAIAQRGLGKTTQRELSSVLSNLVAAEVHALGSLILSLGVVEVTPGSHAESHAEWMARTHVEWMARKDPQGVWMAYEYDGSSAIPFATEIEALRHAVVNHSAVEFVEFGHRVGEAPIETRDEREAPSA